MLDEVCGGREEVEIGAPLFCEAGRAIAGAKALNTFDLTLSSGHKAGDVHLKLFSRL